MRNISLLDHPLHTDSSPFQGNQFYFVLITWTCVSLNNYSHPLPFIGAYSLVHVVICSSSTSALVGTWHLSSHSTSMSLYLYLSPLMHLLLTNYISSNNAQWILFQRGILNKRQTIIGPHQPHRSRTQWIIFMQIQLIIARTAKDTLEWPS